MVKKPNMTVTSRFLDERAPIAERTVPNPFPNPPAGRTPIGRLSFRGPSPKLDCTQAELARLLEASLPNAQFFVDTNIFTTSQLDEVVWNVLFKRQISIVPRAFKELLPWLKTPFCNKAVRDRVVAALNKQVGKTVPDAGEVSCPNIRVLLDSDTADFAGYGWEYYLKLLSLRKFMGPIAHSVLTRKLGRTPDQIELNGEAQRHFGERGALIARKGLEAANSSNMLTDEHLVITAVFTAILRGSEVFIVTRDPDLLEQYYKLLCLMKEHYRAMIAAEIYAANPSAMIFRETPVEDDGAHIPLFSGTSFLRYETTDVDFNPLPRRFHFVNVHCMLLGGKSSDLKLTSCAFCAETEMAAMLKMKEKTGGLSTDKFSGQNCLIHTGPLLADRHSVTVSIGQERTLAIGAMGNIGVDDLNNTLFCNELSTSLNYDEESSSAELHRSE